MHYICEIETTVLEDFHYKHPYKDTLQYLDISSINIPYTGTLQYLDISTINFPYTGNTVLSGYFYRKHPSHRYSSEGGVRCQR